VEKGHGKRRRHERKNDNENPHRTFTGGAKKERLRSEPSDGKLG